jgi:hypothetical protein
VNLNIRCKGTRNRSSKPDRPIDENLIRCLQRYLSLDMEENDISILNIDNTVLRIIPREHNFDFLLKNRDINISTFPKIWTIKSVEFHHTFERAITHNTVKNAKTYGYQSQQCSRARQIYKVNLNIRCKGTRNRWFKWGRPIDENLTRCLQRYLSLDMEENETISILNINNTVLLIIPRKHNFDFHHRTREIQRSSVNVPVSLVRWSLVAGITSLWSNWMLNEEISNISNLSWMKRIDNSFNILIVFGDMGEKASETIRRLWSQKNEDQFWAAANFSELKMLIYIHIPSWPFLGVPWVTARHLWFQYSKHWDVSNLIRNWWWTWVCLR